MSQHSHAELVPGCYRCDLSRDEVMPYFRMETSRSVSLELGEDPLADGDLVLTADAGIKVRVPLTEAAANALADSLVRWYASPMADDKKPSKPPSKPGDITPEQAKKLIEGAKKKDPAEKDQTNPPKKGRR